jgi:hypothetical protein
VGRCDQAALAVSFWHLKQSGVPFCQLPSRYNTAWLQLLRQTVRPPEIKLYHAIRLFHNLRDIAAIQQHLYRYRAELLQKILYEWLRDLGLRADLGRFCCHLPLALLDGYRVGAIMHHLYRKHVASALQHGQGSLAAPAAARA